MEQWTSTKGVRSDLPKGEFETIAPVVSFSTVCLFLILSMILG